MLTERYNSLGEKLHNFLLDSFPHYSGNVLDSVRARKSALFHYRLLNKQTELQKFGESLTEIYADSVKTEEKLLANQLKTIVIDFAKQKEIICIVDKKSVIICEGCDDYTIDLIEYIRQKFK